MLLRFSRLSFWLAAAVAALALLAPRGHETLLTGVAGMASVMALVLWRAGLGGEARSPLARWIGAPVEPVLDDASLAEAAALLVRRAQAAASFEAALHAVAQVLRGELGAREASVHEVVAIDDAHAQVSDLIESQPGFRTVVRRVRLDATPLARALRSQVEAGAPPGAVAVPVRCDGRVVAVIVLSTLDLTLEPKALATLLALARDTLSQRACEARAPAKVLAVEHNAVQPEHSDRLLRPMGCRVAAASGMLRGLSLLPVPGSSGDGERVRELGVDDHLFKPFTFGQSEVPAMLSEQLPPSAPAVLDPAALARLAELDPTGQSRLLERVLLAFQTSAARLRPQFDAARRSDDRAAIRLVAHTLKSSSASIGALELSQLCAQVETAIRVDAGADLAAPLEALDAALDGALQAIDALQKERA
jgi:HPt (histidine-containing phosphotransfer) domain-containing protein